MDDSLKNYLEILKHMHGTYKNSKYSKLPKVSACFV